MKSIKAVKVFNEWDKRGKYLFTTNELSVALGEDGDTLKSTIRRLAADEALVSVSRNLYAYGFSRNLGSDTLQDVAIALRPGEYVYESFESAGSKWGFISQIPMDRITVATTGWSGVFKTPFGVVDYTHLSKTGFSMMVDSVDRSPYGSLRLAKKATAAADLVIARRSLDLIDWEELEDE